MAVTIEATGVRLRLPMEHEDGLGAPQDGEVLVVAQAFAELRQDDGAPERWDGASCFTRRVPTDRDPTLELLAAAEEAGPVEVLGDLRIAGYGVSRWDVFRAPRRIELDPALDALLPPRTRG